MNYKTTNKATDAIILLRVDSDGYHYSGVYPSVQEARKTQQLNPGFEMYKLKRVDTMQYIITISSGDRTLYQELARGENPALLMGQALDNLLVRIDVDFNITELNIIAEEI